MNSIGFNNFRRFASFPEMDLGNITLLVGGNNSGKSTLVKALLLCIDNVRLMTDIAKDHIFQFASPKFRFDANEWHDVKIKTFSRAIHNKPAPSFDLLDDELSLPTQMRFVFTLDNFNFVIEVAGDRDNDAAIGDVTFISIEDRKNMAQYVVNFPHSTMSFSILGSTTERETLVQKLYKEYVSSIEMLNTLSEAGDDISAISAQSEKVASLEKRIEEFVNPDGKELPDDFDYERALKSLFKQSLEKFTATSFGPLPVRYYIDSLGGRNLFVKIIDNFIAFADDKKDQKPTGIKDPDEYARAMQAWTYEQDARMAMKQELDRMMKSKVSLEALLDYLSIEYISAHAANQNTIYNTADRNDYIAETVHEFARAMISRGEEGYRFVTEWMRKFGVGYDFDVISIDDEAYRVIIKDEDGSAVKLADKGMGSIQIMILLLRLATIITIHLDVIEEYKETVEEEDVVYEGGWHLPTIIIEEPEQNLHPKLQSLLADLLFQVNKKYGCKFIIETHSEYLIRKTQVLVANEKYEDERALKENNPFKVYYFDADNAKIPYYQMEYRTDGNFSNEFGTGFFDEANKLLYDIL